jgi:hypothetical protein
VSDENPFEGWCVLEAWRPVPTVPDLYEVSSLGRVRRIGRAARHGRAHGGGARIGRVLKDQPRDGYRAVQLWVEGKPINKLVHVLVTAAFIGPCPEGEEVNHKDGDKANNSASNLEYLTRPANLEHAYATGLRQVSERSIAHLRARRKPRAMVPCGCGCGARLETPDSKGRPRQFITGHNMRRAS